MNELEKILCRTTIDAIEANFEQNTDLNIEKYFDIEGTIFTSSLPVSETEQKN